jgi:outer membrane protein OmpA-like peptidoglycan-associated protein
MSKSACKCKQAACEECPEWIFTFADLVMLMMGFFVILWVLKPAGGKNATEIDEHWLEVVARIREAFKYQPDPTSTDPVDEFMIKELIRKLHDLDPLKNKGMGGETEREPRGAHGTDPEVQTIRPGKHAVVGARVLFDADKADLSDEAKQILDQIARAIRGHRQIFVVKGHASQDDAGGDGTDPKDAARLRMEIAVRRAQVATDYLTAHGVEPEILRVQGCSTYEPVAQRAYTDNRRVLNRRVEVEGTDSPLSEHQDIGQQTSHILPPGLAQDATSGAPAFEADAATAPAATTTTENPEEHH